MRTFGFPGHRDDSPPELIMALRPVIGYLLLRPSVLVVGSTSFFPFLSYFLPPFFGF